jgi:intein/homing endonuclease
MLNLDKYNFKFKKDIQQIVDEAYLGLGDTSLLKINNVLLNEAQYDYDDPVVEFLNIMRKPENFHATCRWLFGVDIVPFQNVILRLLWKYKFPMLLGSRGCSKSFMLGLYCLLRATLHQGCKIVICGASFRQSKFVFEYMEAIYKKYHVFQSIVGGSKFEGPKRDIDKWTFYIGNSEVIACPLGDGCVSPFTATTYDDRFSTIVDRSNLTQKIWSNGEFREISNFLDNGIKPTKIVKTKKGYYFEATYNHRMKICRDREIFWIRTDEMKIGDRILIDRSERWHNGNFDCTDDQAYALGSMIGDGCWTDKYKLGYAVHTDDSYHFIPYLNSIGEWKNSITDKQHWHLYGYKNIQKWIDFWKLQPQCYGINKQLPPNILTANKERMTACLQSLFDTDGTLQVGHAKGGTSICVSFTNTSKVLVEQIHYILLHYGIISTVSSRDRNEKWNRAYELFISGQDVIKFAKQIGFRLKRKQDILQDAVNQKILVSSMDDNIPDIKSEMIRIKSNFKALEYNYGLCISKIKSKKNITFDFAQKFLNQYSHIQDPFIEQLKTLINPNIYYDVITSIEDSESSTYDIEIPENHEYCANGFFSHNSTIRGMRANYIIADEFQSIPRDIFEVVVKGFGAVSESPSERVKHYSKIQSLKDLSKLEEYKDLNLMELADTVKEDSGFGNQTILSGTAYYTFNHLYQYWKKYKGIVTSAGDRRILEEIFQGEVPINFNWKDYCVIRIPYTKVPSGFLDEDQIAQAKATVDRSTFMMEYGAVFPNDSEGFFKRTLLEKATCKPPIMLPSGPVEFSSTLCGSPNKTYVIGIDPASEKDNFAIIVLEIQPDHRRIVYSWTVSRAKMREKLLKAGKSVQTGFYTYCANKIRELCKKFPTTHIGIDSQGGGIAVMEALRETEGLEKGELPILPYVKQGDDDPFWWEAPDKPTDGEPGLHHLHLVNFASAEFTGKANHGMRMDFENQVLIFPFFDSLTLGESYKDDKITNRDSDTLEDCVLEIEELKNELTTIVITETTTGRDHWDTPGIKLPGGKKGRVRKDRYSALLIANMIARHIGNTINVPEYKVAGGYIGDPKLKNCTSKTMYVGPDNLVSKMTGSYGAGVYRGR